MATTPEIQVEDQMDEDFCDKLVGDDEFGSLGSGSASGDMARALSSMSIGDVGASVDNFEGDDQHEVEKVVVSEPREKDSLVLEESSALAQCGSFPLDEVVAVQSSDPVETVAELGSPGSLTGKSVGPKGTSVKEVQWSSFSSGQGQLDMGGFGSYSNFFTEVPNVLTTHSVVGIETKDAVADLSTYFSSFETKEVQHHGFANQHPAYSISSEQMDAQAYGLHNEQAAAGNEFQDWENSLPGWKYDANSGQWYQVDCCDNMTEVQAGGYGSPVMNSREDVHVSTLPVDVAAVRGQISEVSYSQQTAQSVVESVAKYCATAGVSNWNLDSCENTKYPPNMVFNPQYPGWYYDRNTLEWYSLESYTQSLQITSNITQNQQTQDVSGSSDSFSAEQRHTLDDNVFCPSKTQTLGSQSQEQGDWGGHGGNYHQHNICRPEQDDKGGSLDGFSGNQTKGRFYGAPNYEGNYADQQVDFPTIETVLDPLYSRSVGANSFAAFVPAENIYQFSQPKTEEICHANVSQSYSLNQNMVNYSQQLCQSQSASYSQLSYTPNGGRSLEGRPLHALVTFGFGGKLIVMKDTTSFGTNLAYGSQNVTGREVSVLNLAEVVMEKTDFSGIGNHSYDYFHALCKQSFPGPLVCGNAGNKDLNKWVDERITSCGTSTMDFREGELLGLLLSLLKIFCQHCGKLRSPFTVGSALQDSDGPELAVTKLFASARKNGDHLRDYGAFNHCMHNLPSEGQIQSTAIEVQNLLVSGRRKEALQCAQEGQLWGPALVLAAQLGDEFYVDIVKQMARQQFDSGSPLRTLCLLIAGQPADVFSMDNSDNSSNGVMNMSPQPMQVSANGSMLDDWEENLAIITANRTKDDELVIIHLGDCLWKERGEITAAHTCYLVAEANLESYSDKARMCLIGADHWKCPRTYASPEAIQRTEFYEYSKVLGNSQFISIPFQHYKLVYAHMLAELGKIQDSLKYCQATLKLLKNAGRTPEVETLKVLVSSLEERLRTHQQGGYGTNLAPTKLVGKIFNSIDKSLHRMIGAPPQSLPPIPPGNLHTNGHDKIMVAPKVGNSQSTMAMSSLVPLASVETIREWTDDGRKTMHNRSISEPDFGRSPKQVNSSKDDFSTHVQSQTLRASSRFGLFGSQLLQKTVGWMSRSRQAKLGESNKFYYDEQLKRWVEEGAEPPAEEAALLPPPTTAFQNGIPDCNRNNGFITKNISSNGVLETKTSNSIEHSPGIPPVPPSQNQFSAGGRMGVRSRYVDTFNKGGGMPKNSFQSPSVPSVNSVGGAKLFIPTAVTSSELTADFTESTREASSNEDSSASVVRDSSFSSLSSSSSFTMQCFPSMDTISPIKNKGIGAPSQNGNGTLSSQTRAASWNGSYSDAFNHKMTDMMHVANGLCVPSSFAADNYSPMSSTNGLLLANGSSSGDDLHEVEL